MTNITGIIRLVDPPRAVMDDRAHVCTIENDEFFNPEQRKIEALIAEIEGDASKGWLRKQLDLMRCTSQTQYNSLFSRSYWVIFACSMLFSQVMASHIVPVDSWVRLAVQTGIFVVMLLAAGLYQLGRWNRTAKRSEVNPRPFT